MTGDIRGDKSGWQRFLIVATALPLIGIMACTPVAAPIGAPPPATASADDRAALDGQLIAAAKAGDLAAALRLLQQGASINAADDRGVTALIAAAYGNHVDVARALIEAGADVNRQDETRQSAYLISTSEGYLELLRLTLDNGADVRSLDSFNGTGLIRAADRGHVEIVAELLKTDIDVNHVNRLNWTALLEAVILGDGGERHTEVVRLLVDAGADVALADGDGVTPLEHARRRGFTEMVDIMETAGS